ncbi:hypothetical protein BJY21_001904 [Kineosphaera limosa]|nr:hypothetical protein [Kineosphaera limosa]
MRSMRQYMLVATLVSFSARVRRHVDLHRVASALCRH